MGAVQELDWCNAAGSRAGRAEQLRPTEHKVRCLFFPLFLRVVPESLQGPGVFTKIPPTQPGGRGFIYKVGERA